VVSRRSNRRQVLIIRLVILRGAARLAPPLSGLEYGGLVPGGDDRRVPAVDQEVRECLLNSGAGPVPVVVEDEHTSRG
jgi:hypothetical protein